MMEATVNYNPAESLIQSLQDKLKEVEDPELILAYSDRILSALDRLKEQKEPLWTLKEASEYLGIQKETLRRWCHDKKVPHISLGNKKRFEPSRLKKWAINQEAKVHRVWR